MDFSGWRRRPGDAVADLVEAAAGRRKASLLVKGVDLVDVNTGRIDERVDVAIYRDRVAAVGRGLDGLAGDSTQVMNGDGLYAIPGFIDAHMHIESSMMTPAGFAKSVLPLGTTTVFADPHEMANVLGMRGVRLFMEEARRLPLKVFFLVPSCVPASSPELETSGAELGIDDVRELLKDELVVGLGEVMSFDAVIGGSKDMLEKVTSALEEGLVEGHAPQLSGLDLQAYAAAGITSCHESTGKGELVEKLRAGMYGYVREGSAWLDLEETIRAVAEGEVDGRHVALVTDDRDPLSLVEEGHMNYVVRRAIGQGVDPITAIQMATLNPAEHFEMARFIGSIAPLRSADVLLLRRLTDPRPHAVIADGVVVAVDGRLLVDVEGIEYPRWARDTVNARPVTPDALAVRAAGGDREVRVRAIGVRRGSVITEEEVVEADVRGGVVEADVGRDLLRVAVVERHHATGNIGRGFVRGFGLRSGAAASSVSHDSHNIISIGASEEDMSGAINRVIGMGGGISVMEGGRALAEVGLPIAGLVSDRDPEEVATAARGVATAMRDLGCDLPYPFMAMGLLTLTAIPRIKITDRGLVDVGRHRIVGVLA